MSAIIIQKRRIRKLSNYFHGVEEDRTVTIGLPVNERNMDRLKSIGFVNLLDGESVLPRIIGPVTRFNADGRANVRRDLPKETVFRTVEWKHMEFHGQDRVEVTDWIDRPYQRYPREYIKAPSIELTCVTNSNGDKLIIAESMSYSESSQNLLHTVNLFLEIAHEAHILSDDMRPVELPKIHRLGWHILPPGEMPWQQLKNELSDVLSHTRKSQRKFLEIRLETLAEYNPSFTAVGMAGFQGYIVFGYPERNLYILESGYYGNATYVITQDWETLSQLTKAELIHGDLHEDRIIHRSNWSQEIKKLFR